MALRAERSVTGSRGKKKVSNSDNRVGFTERDANDNVGASPGR